MTMRYYLLTRLGLAEFRSVDDMLAAANAAPHGSPVKAFRGWPVDLVSRQVYSVGRTGAGSAGSNGAIHRTCEACSEPFAANPPGRGRPQRFCGPCGMERKRKSWQTAYRRTKAARSAGQPVLPREGMK